MELHGEDLHPAGREDGFEDMVVGGGGGEANPSRFVAVKEEVEVVMVDGGDDDDREIWLQRQNEDLLDVNDASMFYGDFPPLPDFPCMSSSSSSSSTPAPVKAMTCSSSSSSSAASSSSSAASWAVLKSDAEEDVERKPHHDHHHHHHGGQYDDQVDAPPAALSSTASMEFPQPLDESIDACMDVMENFGYMDLVEPNELWDPSSIFHHENNLEFLQDQQPQQQEQQGQQEREQMMLQSNNEEGLLQEESRSSDDLAMVFFEWLKSNKDSVSAEDLRNIKLRRSTIECAAKRLGGGKEGMKQLLKLILEWVQNTQLQKRRMREAAAAAAAAASHFHYQYQEPFQTINHNPSPNPNLNSNYLPPDANPCFSTSPWIPPPAPYVTDPATAMAAPPPQAFPSLVGFMCGDPFSNGAVSASPLNQNINVHPYNPPSTDYHVLDSAHTWPPSQFAFPSHYTTFPDNNLPPAPPHPQAFAGYGNNQYPYQYFPGNGERLVRLGSSATKEARKKRMARQRRFSLHNHRHQNHHNQQNQNQNQSTDQHARLGSDDCTTAAQSNTGNWVYWPSAAASSLPVVPADTPQPHTADRPAMQPQNYQRQIASERRQGWKPEKNLRFLLQKVLKQSDVGNLGRIVLPKKEAETHLPELEARDGISIAMEDIGTSRVWNMRYRFWPNNKSRMYLLENTGDFVRSNGLQEGDFIVIYSDVKCGKYMIRGVKVRQPGSKSEAKRPGKGQRNLHATSTAGNGSSSSPIKQTGKQ
ncbi:hypothetical protein L1049_004220 [Liquidambar formosana]|uniref:TF-B3 domain-containing protein n=1 Tax=Liquidambar formosana TaxID=63359 RepID=A0AAP0WY56_LIQFO